MNGVISWVVAKVSEWVREAREIYCVDPVVFVVLIVACAPFFYYSIFRMVRALAKRKGKGLTLWSSVFLVSTVLPYLYVLFFGRNMPWWIYIVLGLLIGQGVYSLVRRLRKKPSVAGTDQQPGGGAQSAG